MKLYGQNALITGGAKGIGKAIALKLAKEGVNIAIVDIDENNSILTIEELKKHNIEAEYYLIDLEEIEAIERCFKKIIKRFQSINILVNAAGIMQIDKFLSVDSKHWDRVMNINSKALFFSMQNIAGHMIEKDNGGKIINISSITGKSSRPDYPVYAASKATIISLTKSTATALAKYNINVNAICPGYIHTDIWNAMDNYYVENFGKSKGEVIENMLANIPMNRSGKLEEIAGMVAFLCTKEANYITGQSINIDGGAVMH